MGVNFNTFKFLKNIGKSLGDNINYVIINNDSTIDYAEPYMMFQFEIPTSRSVILAIKQNEFLIPMIKNDREARYAAMFVSANTYLYGHNHVKIYGAEDEHGIFKLIIQPFAPIDNELEACFEGISLEEDKDNLEDIFDNLKI